MIAGFDIVYYGPEPWAGMWRNRHHLLSRLARGNRRHDSSANLAREVDGADYLRPGRYGRRP